MYIFYFIKAFKYKLEPNKEQVTTLNNRDAVLKWLYNNVYYDDYIYTSYVIYFKNEEDFIQANLSLR